MNSKMICKFGIWIAIGFMLILSQLQFSLAASTPYPDANAKPTITTKLENLSDLHKSPSSTTTTTTEGYPKLYDEDDKYGKLIKAFEYLFLF